MSPTRTGTQAARPHRRPTACSAATPSAPRARARSRTPRRGGRTPRQTSPAAGSAACWSAGCSCCRCRRSPRGRAAAVRRRASDRRPKSQPLDPAVEDPGVSATGLSHRPQVIPQLADGSCLGLGPAPCPSQLAEPVGRLTRVVGNEPGVQQRPHRLQADRGLLSGRVARVNHLKTIPVAETADPKITS